MMSAIGSRKAALWAAALVALAQAALLASAQPSAECCSVIREKHHRPRFCGIDPSVLTCGGTVAPTNYNAKCHEWNDHGVSSVGPANADLLSLLKKEGDECKEAFLEYQCSTWCGSCVESKDHHWHLVPACSSTCTRMRAACPILATNPVFGAFLACNETAVPKDHECLVIKALDYKQNAVAWGFFSVGTFCGIVFIAFAFTYERFWLPFLLKRKTRQAAAKAAREDSLTALRQDAQNSQSPQPPVYDGPSPGFKPALNATTGALQVEVTGMFIPSPGIIKAIEAVGVAKANIDPPRQLLLGFLAGVFIALGGMCSISFSRAIPSADIGVQKFIFAAVFPVGLMLVMFCGSELITGNFACYIPGLLNGKINFWRMLRNWVLVYAGNFIGSFAVAYFWAYATEMYIKDPWMAGVQGIAEGKVVLNFGQYVLSGMGCNFLVCLAVFMATSARSLAGKVLVIWFPIQTFVTIGFEHCVANMFLIPLGILYGANVSYGEFIAKNLIPVTIGNMISAIVFVACVYWYIYLLPAKWPESTLGPTFSKGATAIRNITRRRRTAGSAGNGDCGCGCPCKSSDVEMGVRSPEPQIHEQEQRQHQQCQGTVASLPAETVSESDSTSPKLNK